MKISMHMPLLCDDNFHPYDFDRIFDANTFFLMLLNINNCKLNNVESKYLLNPSNYIGVYGFTDKCAGSCMSNSLTHFTLNCQWGMISQLAIGGKISQFEFLTLFYNSL